MQQQTKINIVFFKYLHWFMQCYLRRVNFILQKKSFRKKRLLINLITKTLARATDSSDKFK